MTVERYILATGTALPGAPVGNDVLCGMFGINQTWVENFIGNRARHFAVDLSTGDVTHTLADLATQAAAAAMAAAGVQPWEIDFVVLGTATPDELMPATVNRIADRLGIDQVPTYQLQSGCAGAIQALDVGGRLLDADREIGLVIGADVCAKHMVLDRAAGLPPGQLVNYVLFGDGAGAAVLSNRPEPGAMRLHHVLNRFTGRGREPGQVIRWFGLADRDSDLPAFEEDYKAIEQRVPILTRETLLETLELTGWDVTQPTFVLPPQLSGRMTQRIVKGLGMDGATEISCVADTGNNGNALPFLQLDQLAGRIRPGQRAVAVAIESSKWIKGGFTVEAI
ncbi:MAG TPA: 3-oxoacyl-ACP synthase III family protein [Pseudonocardiaceae bacterium]